MAINWYTVNQRLVIFLCVANLILLTTYAFLSTKFSNTVINQMYPNEPNPRELDFSKQMATIFILAVLISGLILQMIGLSGAMKEHLGMVSINVVTFILLELVFIVESVTISKESHTFSWLGVAWYVFASVTVVLFWIALKHKREEMRRMQSYLYYSSAYEKNRF